MTDLEIPMTKTLRPHLTTGLAIAGAALIAVVPAAPHPLPAEQAASVQHRAVALTTAPSDPISPYADLLTNTANNLAYLGAHAFDFPVLNQFLSDPMGSLSRIPDALIALNTLLPSIDVTSSGLPIHLEVGMTPPIDALLALIGPLATLGNSVNDIFAGLTDFTNPVGVISTLLGIPAILLDALLNGKGGIDVAGFHAPVFNGLLVGPQSMDLNFTIGQLVELTGMGNQTIGELADQFGLADQTLAGLATGLLDFFGVGNPTIAELAAQFGLSQQSVAELLISVLPMLGIDNPTITDLADQFGFGDMSLAAVLNQVLDLVGFDTGQSMSSLALMVLNLAGMGNDPSLGDLAVVALNALGMGDVSITELVQQLGFGDQPIGELAKQAIQQLTGTDPTITELLAPFLGDMTIGGIVVGLLDSMGIGNQTPFDLINPLLNPNPGDDITLGDLLVNVIQGQDPSMDFTLSELVQQSGMGSTTIGDLLDSVPVPQVPSSDPLFPYYDVNNPVTGEPWTLAEVPWKAFLASEIAGGMGAKTFKELAAENMGMQLSDFECGAMATFFSPLNCDRTLSSYMGNNSVYDTLHNLKSDGHGIAGVANNTPLTDVTLGQVVNATGQGDLHLSSIILGLNLNNPVSDILRNLGLDNPNLTIDSVFLNGFPWLANTGVIQLLNAWGLNNLDVFTVIDRLGLDMTVTNLLNSLGLGNITLSGLVGDLLGGVHISTILTGLGLDDVTLSAFLNNLLGGVYVNDILTDLGLNNVHINDIITSLLGDTYIGDILNDLGLNNVHLDDVINDLLGGTTLGSVLDDLGVSGATIDTVLSSLGLTDVDVFGASIGDFYGLLPDLLLGVPQQIAAALAG